MHILVTCHHEFQVSNQAFSKQSFVSLTEMKFHFKDSLKILFELDRKPRLLFVSHPSVVHTTIVAGGVWDYSVPERWQDINRWMDCLSDTFISSNIHSFFTWQPYAMQVCSLT